MQTGIIILLFTQAIYSKMSWFTPCVKPEVITPLNITNYTGLWYEIYKDPDFYWEKGGKCTTAYYTALEDGTIGVYNS